MRIYSQKEAEDLVAGDHNRKLWTAIIPAAGRGSRLGYDKPKILYPIAGRTILDWLVDLLEPWCEKMIFVLSPHGAGEVLPHLKERFQENESRFDIVIQEEPKGMADAIHKGVPRVATPYTLVIWGDQVAIRPQTLEKVIKIQEATDETLLTMPVLEREEPYIHCATDERGYFVKVLERREGADMPKVGLNDCGVFAFKTSALQRVFQDEIEKGIVYSKGTEEWNFLPLLPKFETGSASVVGALVVSLDETIGVNDLRDAEILEEYLKRIYE